MSTSPSLRQRRRMQTEAEIERAALELVAASSFDEVSVDQIADVAGVSQRTFFRYFATKDDVVLGYERRVHERFVAAVLSQPLDLSPFDSLRSALIETSHIEPDAFDTVMTQAKVFADAPILRARARGEQAGRQEEVARILSDREDLRIEQERALPGEVSSHRIRILTAAVMAVARAEWEQWLIDGEHTDPSPRIAEAIDLLASGFKSTIAGGSND